MADKALAQYIKQYLDAGYDVNVIRNYLVNYGYPSQQVDEAIQSLSKPAPKAHPGVIIAIVILFIGLTSLGIFTFLKFKAITPLPPEVPWQLLDVSAQIFTKEPYPGENFLFKVELSNLGTTPRYDVNLSYVITNKETRKVIMFERESKAIETTLAVVKEFEIPSYVSPGAYLLDVAVAYGNQSAGAELEFEVFEKEVAPAPECIIDEECALTEECVEGQCVFKPECLVDTDCAINEVCSDNVCILAELEIECIADSDCDPNEHCVEGACEIRPEPECRADRDCGTGEQCINEVCIPVEPECRLNTDCAENQECQDGRCIERVDRGHFYGLPVREIIKRIAPIAEANPRQAALLCSGIERLPDKEMCFIAVSDVSSDIQYCDYINQTRAAYDSCLLNLAYKGDYTVCDYIVSGTKAEMCYSLQRLHLISTRTPPRNITEQQALAAFYTNTTVLNP